MSGHGGGHGGGFTLPFFHELHEWMESTNSSGGFIIPGQLIVVMFIIGALIFNGTVPLQSEHNWGLALQLSPIWLPVMIGRFAMMRFVFMKRDWFHFTQSYVLLELRLPREILKSPRAMETVFASLNIASGESTWHKKYWFGSTRPWWSFEITSIGGAIRFYVRTRVGMRRALESYFYAQYPEIEIIEAKDYSRMRDIADDDAFSMAAFEFKKGNKEPYPIKTYVDFGLDKPALKVEEQVDPFAQLMEIFGSVTGNEQIWFQMVIRVAKGEKFRGAKRTWKDEAKEIVTEIRAMIVNPVSGIPNPTDVQKETIAAVERNVGKLAYDVGMRVISSAPKGESTPIAGTLLNMWKPFNSENYNSINVNGTVFDAKFNNYPWEDLGGKRKKKEHHEAMEFYRYRAFFHPPYRGHWMTMSTEELATIFHFPSSIVKTPSLPRISSSTSSAPTNLPI